jgi:hypothetical protein
MKLKIILFSFSLFTVFFFNSQNVNAGCTYSNPLYATMTPLDKVDARDCVTFNPVSGCDGACGSFVTGCDGTKIKAKDVWACDNPGSVRCWLVSNAEVFSYTYTYKDCGGEPVNKLCYGGRCVECTSNTDCSGGKTCQSNACACPSGTSWDSVSNSCKILAITCTTPSLYTSQTNCESNNCIWCDSAHTPPNKCVLDNTQCSAAACTSDASGCTDDSGTKKNSCATAMSQWQWSCSGSTCAQKEVFCTDYCNWATGACGSGEARTTNMHESGRYIF